VLEVIDHNGRCGVFRLITVKNLNRRNALLTPNNAMEIAFDLIGGSDMFVRAERLAWAAAICPPDTDEDEYLLGLSLSFFLEAGYSPMCRVTGHPYLDAAVYLDRIGFSEDANIIANLKISQCLAVLMGLYTHLSYFHPPAKHERLSKWLTSIDATVNETGGIVSTIDERIYSSLLRHGDASLHTAAWVMTSHTSESLILPISQRLS
jgi:hypothetical protein